MSKAGGGDESGEPSRTTTMTKPSDFAHLVAMTPRGWDDERWMHQEARRILGQPLGPAPPGDQWIPAVFYLPDESLAALKPTRKRKPNLKAALREAARAGVAVKSVTVEGE
jgi:hypothetical protein